MFGLSRSVTYGPYISNARDMRALTGYGACAQVAGAVPGFTGGIEFCYSLDSSKVRSRLADALGRVATTTDPLGTTTTTYDQNGNVTSTLRTGTGPDPAVAANRLTTSATYDNFNRVLMSTDARGKVSTFTYDKNGNRASIVTSLGFTTTYTYDAANRTKTMIDPRGNVSGGVPANFTVTYNYDEAGNQTSVANQLGQTTLWCV